MSDQIAQKIIEILAEQALLAPADISLDHSLQDLGLDSLGLVESIFAIEEAFDITVPFNANTPEDSAFDISCVQAIVDGVTRLIADQHS